jgi:hypothetical protein
MSRKLLALLLTVMIPAGLAARELTSSYVVTAAANKAGVGNTDWHTDLTLYNPHDYALPVVLQFLRSGQSNTSSVPTVTFDVNAWETLNLWDVLGPDGFSARGSTGAFFVYADDQKIACSGAGCDFAVFARTYTLDPRGGNGEFGQAVPGFPAGLGLDRSVIAFMPQIIDDSDFRTNCGVASWTNAMVRVRFDLQDAAGNVIDRRDHWVPPFGHVQWRLEHSVAGGTVAAYIMDGPDDAMVFPYASVVNWTTGDAVNIEAHLTTVGVSAQSAVARGALIARPGAAPAPRFSLQALRRRTPITPSAPQ